MKNMTNKKKKTLKVNVKFLTNRIINQLNLISRGAKRKKRLKIEIISKIKKRSKKRNIVNEISNDIEKVRLEPENLILIDYIDKKISKS